MYIWKLKTSLMVIVVFLQEYRFSFTFYVKYSVVSQDISFILSVEWYKKTNQAGYNESFKNCRYGFSVNSKKTELIFCLLRNQYDKHLKDNNGRQSWLKASSKKLTIKSSFIFHLGKTAIPLIN